MLLPGKAPTALAAEEESPDEVPDWHLQYDAGTVSNRLVSLSSAVDSFV